MKKKLITIIMISSILTGGLLSSTSVYANEIGKTTTITRNKTADGYTIITQNDKQIRTYQSVDSASIKIPDLNPLPDNPEHDFTTTLDAKFIDDKYSSEMTTLIDLSGFMAAKKENEMKKFKASTEITNTRTAILFPIRYSISILNESTNKNVKIVDSVPKNDVSKKDITNTIGYKIGGKISIEEQPNASVESEYAESSTIHYTQTDFSTTQKEHSISKVSWDTNFTETNDGYNLKSYNPMYGNQMFMYGRYTNAPAIENIIPDYKMSRLITGGFNPNMSVVLTAPNGTKESIIKIKMERERNSYFLYWYETHWVGRVFSSFSTTDQPTVDSHVFTFKINWETHKVTAV